MYRNLWYARNVIFYNSSKLLFLTLSVLVAETNLNQFMISPVLKWHLKFLGSLHKFALQLPGSQSLVHAGVLTTGQNFGQVACIVLKLWKLLIAKVFYQNYVVHRNREIMLPAPCWDLAWIHQSDVSSVPAFIGHGKIWAFSSFPSFGPDLGILISYQVDLQACLEVLS